MSGYWNKNERRLDGRRKKGKLTKGQRQRLRERLNEDNAMVLRMMYTLRLLGLDKPDEGSRPGDIIVWDRRGPAMSVQGSRQGW